MQAVILAGGKGTRLAERLQGRPKPLVMVAGVPLLERQILTLAAQGVDDVVVLVNHAADQIEAFFRQRKLGVSVRLVDDGEPRGTAGALLASLSELADQFLVVYGDTLFDIDLAHLLAHHKAAQADVTLLLHPNDHPADSDLVELDEHDRVTRFHGYPHPEGVDRRNLVNAAFYVIEKRALVPWKDFPVPADFAKDLFPAMLEAGVRLNGYVSFEYIKDLGTPKRLDKVEGHLLAGVVERSSRRHLQRAVFLDRDGTLNELRDYVRCPEDFALLPHAAEAVKSLNDAEYRVIVVTNQPVIARGECSIEMLRAIHNRMEARLGDSGAYIEGLYFCPHHPHSGFPGEVVELKVVCNCRKPEAGMILAAVDAMNIDVSLSWMVGDSTTDILAAKRAGLRSVLVKSGEGGADRKCLALPDFICEDIGAAAALITVDFPRAEATVRAWLPDIAAGDLVVVSGANGAERKLLSGALTIGLSARGLVTTLVPYERLGARDTDALLAWLNGGACTLTLADCETSKAVTPPVLHLAENAILIVEGEDGACSIGQSGIRRIWRAAVHGDGVSFGAAHTPQ